MAEETEATLHPEDALVTTIEDKLFGEEPMEEIEQDSVEDTPEDSDPEEETQESKGLDQYLGISPDQVVENENGEVLFKAKIDGETVEVTAKELIKSYQLEGHVNRKSMELSEKQKAFETQAREKVVEYTTKLEQAENIAKLMYHQATAGISKEQLEELKKADPASYVYKRQEMQDAQQKFGTILAKLKQEKENQQELLQQQSVEQMKQHLASEAQKLVQAIPEWNDQQIRTADEKAIGDIMTTKYGFSPEEISMVYDHRLVRLMRDAKNFHDATSNVERAKQKKVPTFQKPGSGRDEQLAKARDVKAKKQALKRNGNSKDALTAVLIDRM